MFDRSKYGSPKKADLARDLLINFHRLKTENPFDRLEREVQLKTHSTW